MIKRAGGLAFALNCEKWNRGKVVKITEEVEKGMLESNSRRF